ncbi:MAG: hypothetical protein ACLFS8_03650 [Clostridia bacterium]
MSSTVRDRRILFALLALSLVMAVILGRWALFAVDRNLHTATSMRRLEFSIRQVDWEADGRDLDLLLEVYNGGNLEITVDEMRFSIYIEDEYVSTNTDTRVAETLSSGESSRVPYSFTLRPHFADIVERGRESSDADWSIRGVAWINVQGMSRRVPVTVRKEVAP